MISIIYIKDGRDKVSSSMTHVCHFVLLAELQHQLNAIDKKLTQKNEEMNILLNYKVS